MTPKPTLLLCLLACASLPGCTVCQNIKRTILDEPSEFSWMDDREHSIEVYRSWADQAWREQGSSDPEQCNSGAYTAGFKDGFVDYVYGGGSGEPPPVPPRPFWNVDIRNPRGHTEATDWFAGYRHGAQVAREEGYRKRALVPLSMFLMGMREESQTKQPYYNESTNPSLPNPIADPWQPEYAVPSQIQPELIPNSSVDVTETEQLPALPAPTKDLPEADAPNVEDPTVKEKAPATEPLPQPPTMPEESPLPQLPVDPQQPRPIENHPEETQPPTDLDDLFGSSARARKPQPLRRANYDMGAHRDPHPKEISVGQARSAFASAIRSRSASNKPSNTRVRATSTHVTRPTRLPRQATIPKSKDRAKEMFRRLSP